LLFGAGDPEGRSHPRRIGPGTKDPARPLPAGDDQPCAIVVDVLSLGGGESWEEYELPPPSDTTGLPTFVSVAVEPSLPELRRVLLDVLVFELSPDVPRLDELEEVEAEDDVPDRPES